MASIDCVLDTNPMANSISSVSKHIDGTTAAVVGMKAAVIKAEAEAADHVCDNVNRGFFTLIRSQISQKLAKLQSEVDSHLMNLNQQRKQLLALKSRMERDYNMICSRYLKLFTTINRNLETRVAELDRPVMNFAMRDMDQISNRPRLLTATVPVSQNESVTTAQRISASNVKYRANRAIQSINMFLDQSMTLQEITSQILLRQRINRPEARLLMPALICESRIDSNGNLASQTYVSPTALGQQAQNVVKGVVSSQISKLRWADTQVSPQLRSEFARLIEASGMSERAKDQAMKLFSDNSFQTLTKGN